MALAGFENPFPFIRPGTTEEERLERVARERRTVFVGMTRAMRALLVAVPENVASPLLDGFSEALWNVARA